MAQVKVDSLQSFLYNEDCNTSEERTDLFVEDFLTNCSECGNVLEHNNDTHECFNCNLEFIDCGR